MSAFNIVFFNHKGGVSKTTTTFHLGWKLAEKGYKVLLVDADPQCNLTGICLGENFEKYYLDEATKHENIKDAASVVFEGRPIPLQPLAAPQPRENLFLIPGHPSLGEHEASLSFAMHSANVLTSLMNLPGAFPYLINLTAEKYECDFVLLDLNPSLSAINQLLFLSADAFILPTMADPFSLMALQTLEKILPKWQKWLGNKFADFEDATYPLPKAQGPQFLGQVINRFNVREGNPTRQTQGEINNLENYVSETFVPALQKANLVSKQTETLIKIPDFQGLVYRAFKFSTPVFALTEEQLKSPLYEGDRGLQGNVLATYQSNQKKFLHLFDDFSDKIIQAKEAYAAG